MGFIPLEMSFPSTVTAARGGLRVIEIGKDTKRGSSQPQGRKGGGSPTEPRSENTYLEDKEEGLTTAIGWELSVMMAFMKEGVL